MRKFIMIATAFALLFCIGSLSDAAKRDKQYVAKQITNLKVDGNLNEWKRAEVVAF